MVTGLQRDAQALGNSMTPKMFQHRLKAQCLKSPQRIVLPEVRTGSSMQGWTQGGGTGGMPSWRAPTHMCWAGT